jgi:pimeloyl-ACP methyl ester carboxylesterase
MNGGSQSWAHLFQSLAPSFRVVAWDAPGFGESDVFGDSVEDFKAGLLHVMILMFTVAMAEDQ